MEDRAVALGVHEPVAGELRMPPQSVQAGQSVLGGLMPEPTQASAPMDLFGRAAWEQQLLFDRIAADLRLLSGVQGAQVRCLECGAVAGLPTIGGETNSGNWFDMLLSRLR